MGAPEMRRAVLECVVGDEQKDEDPTTNELAASDLVAALRSDDIQIGAFGQRRLRIVTHLDVNAHAADLLV